MRPRLEGSQTSGGRLRLNSHRICAHSSTVTCPAVTACLPTHKLVESRPDWLSAFQMAPELHTSGGGTQRVVRAGDAESGSVGLLVNLSVGVIQRSGPAAIGASKEQDLQVSLANPMDHPRYGSARSPVGEDEARNRQAHAVIHAKAVYRERFGHIVGSATRARWWTSRVCVVDVSSKRGKQDRAIEQRT